MSTREPPYHIDYKVRHLDFVILRRGKHGGRRWWDLRIGKLQIAWWGTQ